MADEKAINHHRASSLDESENQKRNMTSCPSTRRSPRNTPKKSAVLLRHLQDVKTTQFHHAVRSSSTPVPSCSTTMSSYSTQASLCSSRASHLHHQTTLKGQDLSK